MRQYLHCATQGCREAVEGLMPWSVDGEPELGAESINVSRH